jgi:predicted RNase H-like HicB family nuclease
MKYAYPVILTPEGGQYMVRVPDLKTIHTFGDGLPEALEMAQDAIEMWLWQTENQGGQIPPASPLADVAKLAKRPGQIASLVMADTDEYRRRNETRAVKKTLTIPAWLNYQAEKVGAPFSQILQRGLKEYLQIEDSRPGK